MKIRSTRLALIAVVVAALAAACKIDPGSTSSSGGDGTSGSTGGGGGNTVGCVFSDDGDCEACLESTCVTQLTACNAKNACVEEIDCADSCSDDGCVEECKTSFGSDDAPALSECAINNCADTCANASFDIGPCGS